MSEKDYRALITVPSNDSNFLYALKRYATIDDLERAAAYLTANPEKNKSRLTAVKTELRRRTKEGQQ